MKRRELEDTKQYFRTYSIKFGEQIDETNQDQLVFEGYVVVSPDSKIHKKKSENNKIEDKNKPVTVQLDKLSSNLEPDISINHTIIRINCRPPIILLILLVFQLLE